MTSWNQYTNPKISSIPFPFLYLFLFIKNDFYQSTRWKYHHGGVQQQNQQLVATSRLSTFDCFVTRNVNLRKCELIHFFKFFNNTWPWVNCDRIEPRLWLWIGLYIDSMFINKFQNLKKCLIIFEKSLYFLVKLFLSYLKHWNRLNNFFKFGLYLE